VENSLGLGNDDNAMALLSLFVCVCMVSSCCWEEGGERTQWSTHRVRATMTTQWRHCCCSSACAWSVAAVGRRVGNALGQGNNNNAIAPSSFVCTCVISGCCWERVENSSGQGNNNDDNAMVLSLSFICASCACVASGRCREVGLTG
jgi:hypothetical protein